LQYMEIIGLIVKTGYVLEKKVYLQYNDIIYSYVYLA